MLERFILAMTLVASSAQGANILCSGSPLGFSTPDPLAVSGIGTGMETVGRTPVVSDAVVAVCLSRAFSVKGVTNAQKTGE